MHKTFQAAFSVASPAQISSRFYRESAPDCWRSVTATIVIFRCETSTRNGLDLYGDATSSDVLPGSGTQG
jgi:hypothetical protein